MLKERLAVRLALDEKDTLGDTLEDSEVLIVALPVKVTLLERDIEALIEGVIELLLLALGVTDGDKEAELVTDEVEVRVSVTDMLMLLLRDGEVVGLDEGVLDVEGDPERVAEDVGEVDAEELVVVLLERDAVLEADDVAEGVRVTDALLLVLRDGVFVGLDEGVLDSEGDPVRVTEVVGDGDEVALIVALLEEVDVLVAVTDAVTLPVILALLVIDAVIEGEPDSETEPLAE